jgi:hypothetical protein
MATSLRTLETGVAAMVVASHAWLATLVLDA